VSLPLDDLYFFRAPERGNDRTDAVKGRAGPLVLQRPPLTDPFRPRRTRRGAVPRSPPRLLPA